MSEQEASEENNEAKFSFGGPCPPVGSWFFPIDPSKEPFRIEDGNEQDDSPQPA
jgi:hypothetical protein